jgi:predicted nucleic acid-binding protein
MRAARIVLDASAFIRGIGLADSTEAAFDWLERIHDRRVEGLAPELLFAEVGSGLLVYVRAGALELDAARSLLDRLLRLPLRVFSLRELAVPALAAASARGLSVYDACYVVLAERAHVPLLTADAGAAAAAADSILLR